jgi:hypothetical protein
MFILVDGICRHLAGRVCLDHRNSGADTLLLLLCACYGFPQVLLIGKFQRPSPTVPMPCQSYKYTLRARRMSSIVYGLQRRLVRTREMKLVRIACGSNVLTVGPGLRRFKDVGASESAVE